MTGQVIRAVEITRFGFDGLGKGSSQKIVAAQHVDVSQFVNASLMVRVHGVTIDALSSGAVQVHAYADGHTAEDPASEFRATTSLGSVTVDTNTSAPAYLTAQLTSGLMGAMVAILVEGSQDSQAVYTLSATLSIDLALKE